MAKNLKAYRKTKQDSGKLNETAEKLIQMAREGGCEQNYFFQTTFERYQEQLDLMARLQEVLHNADDLMMENARGGYSTHPAISEYNKTSTAANQTAAMLIKVILTFSKGQVTMGGGSDSGEESEEDIDL